MRKCLLACLAMAVCSRAADDADSSPAPQPAKVGGITIQGNFRTRVENWNWFQGDGANNAYTYLGSLLRLSLSQSR